ncbi:hypothetical protein UC35_16720 [Ramlibacter tataouinensis]|uniref:Uncharacterized protein n=1 Tax=Ramlibacter tataouinensis TaxID=94132 RepID=A0A127JW16_9BURK|nr:hypothetical protein UC35_16720 [Ramlibacter tataouinensis]
MGAVSLVKCRIKDHGRAALAARNSLEPALEANGFLKDAPFRTVSLILRYGDRDNLNPDIGDVDARRSALPVAVELDAKRLEKLDLNTLTEEFRSVMIELLCDVAANFDLPFEFLDAMRKPLAKH